MKTKNKMKLPKKRADLAKIFGIKKSVFNQDNMTLDGGLFEYSVCATYVKTKKDLIDLFSELQSLALDKGYSIKLDTSFAKKGFAFKKGWQYGRSEYKIYFRTINN
jgi:hypothetical protein